MEIHFVDVLQSAVGLLVGGVIGLGFGMVQDAARRRHEKLLLDGKLKDGWSIMPGSGARIAYLLIALLAIQVICPLLFVAGTQWWVSGGLAAGYGWSLLQNILRQRKANRT
ncbi:MAG TPA: hypothetical protein VNW30_11710 [Opitutaceae bacterium]|jgi:hypothetical protein|nr:hypothetical protein [Opitutaceae bacterium]